MPALVDEPLGGVVVLQLVLKALDDHRVLRKPFVGDRLLEAEMVLALFHFHLLADHPVRAAEHLELAFVVVVGIDNDVDMKRLSFADLSRDAHVGDLHFGIIARR